MPAGGQDPAAVLEGNKGSRTTKLRFQVHFLFWSKFPTHLRYNVQIHFRSCLSGIKNFWYICLQSSTLQGIVAAL
jgi:hypothetical protein